VAEQLDPRKIWQEALAKGLADPGLVVATADFLFEQGYYEHAVEFLKANLRQGIIVQPWVYEALAIAMEQNGEAVEEILRVRLSAMSLDPKNAQSYIRAAQAANDAGNYERALAFCKQAAQLDPTLAAPYADALVYADKVKDTTSMAWAVGKLTSQEWASDTTSLQLKARKNLDNLVAALQKENRGDEAAKLRASLASLKVRDLVIKFNWEGGVSGVADLEMEVKEPTGAVCSSQIRQSTGGGVLTGLNLTTMSETNRELPKATYTAAEAFSGEYEVKVTRLWGQPAGGKFRLEVVHHQGTPHEKHQIFNETIDQTRTIKFVLATGRRKEVAQVTQPTAQASQVKNDQVKTQNVLSKLRELADPVHTAGMPRGVSAAVNKGKGMSGVIPALAKENKSKEVMIYQDGINSVGGGMTVTTQARVTADGQYMRLTVNPVFQAGTLTSGEPRIDLPLIPGGR
jgi:tetratricopeptide (TPR) repeat protein